MGALNAMGYEKSRFSTNISFYLGNHASSGITSNDLERRQTQISRSRHYLTMNISETVRDTYIVTMKY